MKRANNLYPFLCEFNVILNMTYNVCKRVKNKKKVDRFESFISEHLYHIKTRLDSKDLNVGKYNIFMITDPKCRIVMAQNIEDKIINHLIAEYVLVKVFESKHTDSMCATRLGKGTIYGVKLLKKYLNKMKRDHNNFYYLKIDIKKYFYSIDHNILKKILISNIKDKDALNMLFSIIDSTNFKYVNERIKKLKDGRIKYLINSNLSNKNKLIEEVNNIPLYKYGKGVALGNQTSQAFGLIYLYSFNHFLKEDLKLKYVINYMDDFVILHESKEYLKECLNKIVKELKKNYKLDINYKKTNVNSIRNGIDFLGYRFLFKGEKFILRLRLRSKKKFKRKVKNLNYLYNNGYINDYDYTQGLASYKGLLKWGNCKNLNYKVMKGDNNVRKVL